MKMNFKKGLLFAAFLSVMLLFSKGEANAASKRLFDIVVKDGYTTQTIEMKYGKSQFGYMTYYANQSTIYVNPKAKKVTFRVKRNSSSRYGNFKFASRSMKPGKTAKSNLFNYTVDGKTRAWMFTVQKVTNPEIKLIKLKPSTGGKHFITGKKKTLQIKTKLVTQIPVKLRINILDETGKLVYQQRYTEAGTKTYSFKWNGKPMKGNKAGLNPKKYVADGNYTVEVTATLKIGKQKQFFTQQKSLVIGE